MRTRPAGLPQNEKPLKQDLLEIHRRRRALRRLLCASPLVLLAAGCYSEPTPRPRPGNRQGNGPSDTGVVLKARSLRVQDGDSFVARLADGSSRTIRLSGIDAPERGQAQGDLALQNLRRLLENRDIRIRVAKTDAYGRAVAQVLTGPENEPVDVGLEQVTAGMAWFYHRYRQDLPADARGPYAEAERRARQARRGLWQADDPQPPWDFRRHQDGEPRGERGEPRGERR